ncbi:hypothetical protein [Thiorhodovibrio frisius]|uniref:hypothetical protein n=1 Tax=Thiorhodovibrio frisius TaxID=631362 RepID=UPI000A306428|nr:hypothetical protein [Thiorhodovibrio frisius]
MNNFKALLLTLIVGTQLPIAQAKCLPMPDSGPSNCRYPAGDSWCANNDRQNPYAFSDECLRGNGSNAAVKSALQNELSVEGAVIRSIKQIVQDAPNQFSVDFTWSIDGLNYSCSGSVTTNKMNQVVQASIPYVCYRQYLD